MRLGKFKQARESFERAQEELYSYELQSRFSQFGGFTDNAVRNLKTRLKFQLIIIGILTGHSRNRHLSSDMSDLESLRDERPEICDSLRDKLTIWLAKCYNVRGKYRKAALELRKLDVIKKLETSVSSSLANLPVVGSGSVKSYADISGLQAFALTLGYQGLLDRAQEIIRSLLGYFESSILPGIKRQDGVSQSLPRDSDAERLLDKHNRVLYTAALIDSISGNYHSALQLAIKAWEGQKERLGERQLQSLDSAALVASLLALLGQTKKADGICAETLTALQHSDEASPDPFQTLGSNVFLFPFFDSNVGLGRPLPRQ